MVPTARSAARAMRWWLCAIPPERSAPAASRRPEGQPVDHHTYAPGHQPQDPIDDGQWPGHDQEQDRDEAAMIAALTDNDYLGALSSHWSRRVGFASGPTLARRPPGPRARNARAGRYRSVLAFGAAERGVDRQHG